MTGVLQQDYLPALLHRGDLSAAAVAAGLAVAFGLGAVHALSPGHGKTIVAAYLVGSRGTLRHALLLGASVTFTHTISVFLLGIGTLFLSAYIVPEKIIPVLATVSGLSIVVLGSWLLVQRWRRLAGYHHHHHHDHHHDHDHVHDHSHDHDHDHAGGHHHHDHLPPESISVGGLIALGASGGLAPCPSALVLLLSAIALNRIALGLGLLTAFSLGLAGVLIAIGAAVIYGGKLIPGGARTMQSPFFRYLPVVSAAVIVCVGIAMTGMALGWWRVDALGS
jgi:ABC-type nickel/cobalt efflux system permease component RcnA